VITKITVNRGRLSEILRVSNLLLSRRVRANKSKLTNNPIGPMPKIFANLEGGFCMGFPPQLT
ncbi:MAG TPA: hypothetical protein PLB68_05755, partial [Candidatus Aminicenantes bacterium]|nr:hypothetical protein [Candidatus Aminicenantes bacterium]